MRFGKARMVTPSRRSVRRMTTSTCWLKNATLGYRSRSSPPRRRRPAQLAAPRPGCPCRWSQPWRSNWDNASSRRAPRVSASASATCNSSRRRSKRCNRRPTGHRPTRHTCHRQRPAPPRGHLARRSQSSRPRNRYSARPMRHHNAPRRRPNRSGDPPYRPLVHPGVRQVRRNQQIGRVDRPRPPANPHSMAPIQVGGQAIGAPG